jgi:hypothetical protein
MKYNTRSEKELAEANLLPKGEYPFEIADAKEQKSKAGNDMLVLEVDCIGESGARKRITDYIVPGTIWADKKLHDLMWSVGLGEKYASGTITADDLVGRSGLAAVGIDKGKPFTAKDGTEREGFDKNKIAFYKRPESAPSSKKPQPTEAQLANQAQGGANEGADEDVPF